MIAKPVSSKIESSAGPSRFTFVPGQQRCQQSLGTAPAAQNLSAKEGIMGHTGSSRTNDDEESGVIVQRAGVDEVSP